MTVPMPFAEISPGWHLYRDGQEMHCHKLKLTDDECDWYSGWWHNWYTADWAYALPVVYFFCATIGVLSVLHWMHVIGTRHKRSAWRQRSSARCRSVLGRSTFIAGWSTPNIGIALIIGAGLLFSLVLVVAHQPYYWPDGLKFGTTPPIGIRAGWISLAMLPFLIILASKVNPLTILTGMSYEHLNVFHRWTAWAMYVATLVHTFGFVVQNTKEKAWTARIQSTNQYWTGFVALVPQTALMVLSIRPVRSRGFEVFKNMSLFYVIMLFVHCEFILSSVDYFIALGSIYLFLLAIRWARALGRNGFQQADVHAIDQDFLRVSIPSRGLKWSASQHYLVRFYAGGLSGLSSHPFTVSSTPGSGGIELIIRCRAGITDRLARQIATSSGSRAFKVLLDGPYGGLPTHFHNFEHVILVAGGSGASFALGALRFLVKDPRRVRRISILFASHSQALLHTVSWGIASLPLADNLAITHELFDTSAVHDIARLDSGHQSSEKISMDKEAVIDAARGRPDLNAYVHSKILQDGLTSVAVAVCGPAQFSHAVTTAVADCQAEVARGTLPCSIELHTEAFDS